MDVEGILRVTQGLQIRLKYFFDHRSCIVIRGQILVDKLHGLHQFTRKGELDLLEPTGTDGLAKTDNASLAHFCPFCDLGHGHVHDVGGILRDEIRNATGSRRQVLSNCLNTINNPGKRLSSLSDYTWMRRGRVVGSLHVSWIESLRNAAGAERIGFGSLFGRKIIEQSRSMRRPAFACREQRRSC